MERRVILTFQNILTAERLSSVHLLLSGALNRGTYCSRRSQDRRLCVLSYGLEQTRWRRNNSRNKLPHNEKGNPPNQYRPWWFVILVFFGTSVGVLYITTVDEKTSRKKQPSALHVASTTARASSSLHHSYVFWRSGVDWPPAQPCVD